MTVTDPIATTQKTDLDDNEGLPSIYKRVPLCQLPKPQALDLIDRLFALEERFAQGFYRYWRDILNQPDPEALESTKKEVAEYVELFKNSLEDPHFHTIGFDDAAGYDPVGIYGFRPLEEHQIGRDVIKVLEEVPALKERYQGKLSMAHAFSALNGHRNHHMLKYAFLSMALEARDNGYDHIFFFVSDFRLKTVYSRYGLKFPEELILTRTKHLVGSFSLDAKNLKAIDDMVAYFERLQQPS